MGFDKLSPEANQFATRLIRRKARQLAGRHGFSRSDRQDLEQELMLQLLRRLVDYRADQGTIFAFITTVIERQAATLVRRQTAQMRDPRRVATSLNVTIEDGEGGCIEMAATITESEAQGRHGAAFLSHAEQVDRTVDIAAVLDQLPPELRTLCDELQSTCATAAARNLGISRSELYQRIARLRLHFTAANLREYR